MKTYLNVTIGFKLLLLAFSFFALAGCSKNENNAVDETPTAVLYPGYQYQRVGASAHDILSDSLFTSLTIEVQYMKGFKPEEEALAALQSFLQRHAHKPGGITIKLTEIEAGAAKVFYVDDIQKIETANRSLFPVNKNLTLYLVVVDGSHADGNFLGIAYRNTSAVLFGETIRKHSGYRNILTKAELETSVLLHEAGHLLGLGAAPLAAASPKGTKGIHHHCENQLCLMYHATETRDLSIINRKGKIPQLDEACLQLLKANGGRDSSAKATPLRFLSGF